MKLQTPHITAAAILLAISCSVPQIHASGPSTWSATPVDGDWSNASNWSAGDPPDGSTGQLTFGSSTITSLTNDISGVSFNEAIGMVFQDGASAYTIGGNPITFTVNAATEGTIRNESTSTQTFNLDMVLTGGSRSIHTTTGGGNVVVNGDISQSTATQLWLTGNGVVTLAGNNTFSLGIVMINSPTLEIASATALGSGVLAANSSTVKNTSGGALTFANGVSGSGNGTTTWDLAHDLTFTGDTFLNSTRRHQVNAGGILTLNTVTAANLATNHFDKRGVGTLRVTGDVAVTTIVTQGTLLLHGGNITSDALSVTVANTAILGGPGSIGADTTVNAGGRLAPGMGVTSGTMTFTEGLDMVGASFVDFKGGDLLDVGGELSLSGTWTLALGSRFQDGGSTTVFNYGSIDLAAGALDAARINASGLGFTPSGSLSFIDTGTSIVLDGISVIPEPSSALLLATSLAAMALVLRKRRQGEKSC